MHPFLLALQLNLTAVPIELKAPHFPTHYISTAGYADASISTLPITDTQLAWPTTSHKLSRGIEPGHTGIDIDAKFGEPVLSVYAGTVLEVTHNGPYGNKIIVQHAKHPTVTTILYAHLTDILVQPGEQVKTGQLIGTVGATGNATGSHLHLETYFKDLLVDPLTVL